MEKIFLFFLFFFCSVEKCNKLYIFITSCWVLNLSQASMGRVHVSIQHFSSHLLIFLRISIKKYCRFFFFHYNTQSSLNFLRQKSCDAVDTSACSYRELPIWLLDGSRQRQRRREWKMCRMWKHSWSLARVGFFFLCVDFSHPRIVPCQMTHVKKKLAECVLARNTTSSHESRLIEKKVFPHRVWVCAFENTMISTILTERKKFSQQWITVESLFERDSIALTMTMKNCVKLERSSKLSEHDDTKTFRSANSNVHLFSSFQVRLSSSTSA